MHPKTIDFIGEKLSYKQNPGPGSHQELNLSPKSGKFAVSTYSNTKFGTIDKSKRF